MSNTISNDHVAFIHYTLRNDAGELLDSSAGGDPLLYLHGHLNIVPGLEKQLTGKQVGDTFKAVVSPEEGYGVRHPGSAQRIERSEFPAEMEIIPGMQLVLEDNAGQQVPVWISKVEGDGVWLDSAHPLAGVTLNFDIEVVRVRPATAAELEQGHPLGTEGDPEPSCGCC
ncbi:MAG: peptidylprolyl isomerase [Bradymonadia bacterium]